LWIVRKVEKFPRSFRFSIGERLIARSLDVLETFVEAAYAADKRNLPEHAGRRVNSLRYLLRLSGDLGLLSGDSREFTAASWKRSAGWWAAGARRGRFAGQRSRGKD
jgi:hypothetical protein